ncbi:MAG: tetratricopeptide repeat protein [Spirochaetales bacterium]|nr:tetratricopeptide repeat protein [Spirochaetales bacterium]
MKKVIFYIFLILCRGLAAEGTAQSNFRQAETLASQARFSDAVYHYRMAIEKNPGYKDAHLGLAQSYFELAELGRALQSLESVFRMDEKNTRALLLRGRIHTRLGNREKALADLNQVRSADPGNPQVLTALGDYYETEGKSRLAFDFYRRIVQNHPAHFLALLGLARHYAREGRSELALAHLEKARRINSMHHRFHESRGLILLHAFVKSGNQDELLDARRSFLTALELSPDNPALERHLYRIDLLLGDLSGALDRASRLYERHPEDAQTLALIATLKARQGQKTEALSSYAKFLKQDSSDSLQRFAAEELALTELPPLHAIRRSLAAYHRTRRQAQGRLMRRDRAFFHLERENLLYPDSPAATALVEEYRRQGNHELFLHTLYAARNRYPSEKSFHFQLENFLSRRNDYLPLRENLLAHPSLIHGEETVKRQPWPVFPVDFKALDPLQSPPGSEEILPEAIGYFINRGGRLRAPPASERRALLEEFRQMKNRKGPIFYSAELSAFLEQRRSRTRYILTGSYLSFPEKLRLEVDLIERNSGTRLVRWTLEEEGQDALYLLGARLAEKLQQVVPLQGNVVKLRPGDIFLNVGSLDGLVKDKVLDVYRGGALRGKVRVVEVATYVARAVPEKTAADRFQVGDLVKE